MEPDDRGAGRFFAALLGVTAIPLLAYSLSEFLLPGNVTAGRASLAVTFLGSTGHVAASFFFYGDARVRGYMLDGNRGRFLIAPLLVIASTSLLFATAAPLLPYAITLYWMWQTHHYTRQNHGILAFASRAYTVSTTELERTALTLSGVGGVLGGITRLAPLHDTILASWIWHLNAVAVGTYAAGWACYLVTLVRARGQASHPMRRVVFAVLMLFYLPLFVFDNLQVAVGSYAMAHGLQYLIFMSYVAAVPRAALLRRAAALVAFIVLVGAGLEFLQRPGPFGDWRMAVYGAYLGIVMCHFVLDAGVWRLSQPFPRSYMAERFRFLQPRP